jgi:hypothetical protein
MGRTNYHTVQLAIGQQFSVVFCCKVEAKLVAHLLKLRTTEPANAC